MQDERKNRPRKTRGDASEIGRVRVFSRPGPDAEDRLRRLMSLMVRYATQDGQDGKQRDHLQDEPDPDAKA